MLKHSRCQTFNLCLQNEDMRRLDDLGQIVRAARKRLGYKNQAGLAALVGVDPRRLSELELGRRPLGPEVMGRLAECLGLPQLRDVAKCSGCRGPRQEEASFLRTTRVSRPLYDPPRDRSQEVRRHAARLEDGGLMESLQKALRERPDAQRVAWFLESISSASWLEYLYPAWELTSPDASPLRLAPNEVGYAHYALVDPETHAAVGDRLWPCLGIRRQGLTVLQFFNATMRTPKRLWTVDILQYSRRRRAPARWSVVEIDGLGHRGRWDRVKEEQVALSTLRLTGDQVRSGQAWSRIASWLETPGARAVEG